MAIPRKKASRYLELASLGEFYNKLGFLTKYKLKGTLRFGKVKYKVLFENHVGTQKLVSYIF